MLTNERKYRITKALDVICGLTEISDNQAKNDVAKVENALDMIKSAIWNAYFYSPMRQIVKHFIDYDWGEVIVSEFLDCHKTGKEFNPGQIHLLEEVFLNKNTLKSSTWEMLKYLFSHDKYYPATRLTNYSPQDLMMMLIDRYF